MIYYPKLKSITFTIVETWHHLKVHNFLWGCLHPPPCQANCKNWAPFSWSFDIYYSFGFQLVAVFLRFSGCFCFFSQFRHPWHPTSLLFLNFFSECWQLTPHGGQWASFSWVLPPLAQTSSYASDDVDRACASETKVRQADWIP